MTWSQSTRTRDRMTSTPSSQGEKSRGFLVKKTSSSSNTKAKQASGFSYVMSSNNDTLAFILEKKIKKLHGWDIDILLIFSEGEDFDFNELFSPISGISIEFPS